MTGDQPLMATCPASHSLDAIARELACLFRYMRGKLPLGELQPVQVCGLSKQHVAKVMKEGIATGATMEDQLSELDRLADML